MNRLKIFVTSAFLVVAAGNANAGNRNSYNQNHHSNYRYSDCVPYELHARGGKAGIRFMHNIGNYRQIRNGIYRGEVCGNGPLRVELSKQNPSTSVVLKIAGQRYGFRPGEPSHRYIKTWHRKYINLDLAGRDRYGHDRRTADRKHRRHDYNNNRNHSHRNRYDRYDNGGYYPRGYSSW